MIRAGRQLPVYPGEPRFWRSLEELAGKAAAPESSEEIEVARIPLGEVPALIEEVEDAKTLAGLLLLMRRM